MHRRAFLRRMVFAGLATWFLDLPLPREPEVGRFARGVRVTFPTDRGPLSVFYDSPTADGLDVGDYVTDDRITGSGLVGVVDYVTVAATGEHSMSTMRALASA